MIERALRAAILAAADSRAVRRLVRRYGMRLGAARFVAGRDARRVRRRARPPGGSGSPLQHDAAGRGRPGRARGDEPSRRSTAASWSASAPSAADERRAQAHAPRPRAGRGPRLRERRERVVDAAAQPRARSSGSTWSSRPFVDATLRVYRRLRESGRDNVGTVLQSYLYRSEDDLRALLRSSRTSVSSRARTSSRPSSPIRESRTSTRPTCDWSRRRCEAAPTPAVATHDDRMIEGDDRIRRARNGSRARPLRAPAPLRRAAAVAARARRTGLQGARRDAVRAGVVPVSDAPARRAAGEPALLRAEPLPAVGVG